VAEVGAEVLHIDGTGMTATGSPSHEGNVWTAGLGLIVVNNSDSASWDSLHIPILCIIMANTYGTNIAQYGFMPYARNNTNGRWR